MNAFSSRWWDSISPADLQIYMAGSPAQAAEVIQVHAERGNAEAQAQLGQLYLSGYGVSQDAGVALRWFGAAADLGHLMARNMLGRCHQFGWGCEPNPTTAVRHYRIAADAGLDWGLYNYAMLLTSGSGVEQDEALAFDLFLRAAQAGHAKSMNLVGRFYEEGIVVQRDVAHAKLWYQRSAEGGDFRGQFSYAGVLLAESKLDDAMPWLTRALHGGNLNFLRAVRGDLALHPNHVIRNIASDFHRRAADLGDDSDREVFERLSLLPDTE
jgi:TPR repeat protein